MLKHQIIGGAEIIDFPEFQWEKVKARVDTGAKISALHCHKVTHTQTKKGDMLNFWLELSPGKLTPFSTKEFHVRTVKNSFGQVETRYAIKTLVVINGRKIRGKFTLANRRKMTYPVLIGRNFLLGRFLVDVSTKRLD